MTDACASRGTSSDRHKRHYRYYFFIVITIMTYYACRQIVIEFFSPPTTSGNSRRPETVPRIQRTVNVLHVHTTMTYHFWFVLMPDIDDEIARSVVCIGACETETTTRTGCASWSRSIFLRRFPISYNYTHTSGKRSCHVRYSRRRGIKVRDHTPRFKTVPVGLRLVIKISKITCVGT